LIPRGVKFFVDDHLADQTVNGVLGQIEDRGKLLQTEGVVKRSKGKEVCSQTLFLNLSSKHCLDLFGVGKKIPNLK